jgi:hypothetical protein
MILIKINPHEIKPELGKTVLDYLLYGSKKPRTEYVSNPMKIQDGARLQHNY